MTQLKGDQPNDQDERERRRPQRPLIGRQVELEPQHEREEVGEHDKDRVRQDDQRPASAQDPLEDRAAVQTSHRARSVIQTERRISERSWANSLRSPAGLGRAALATTFFTYSTSYMNLYRCGTSRWANSCVIPVRPGRTRCRSS